MVKDRLNVGQCMNVMYLNIEGISKEKSEVLHRIAVENDVDVLCLQETHTKSDEDLFKRSSFPTFDLVDALNDPRYGIATYVKNTIQNCNFISKECLNDIANICIELGGTSVINVYKPPSRS